MGYASAAARNRTKVWGSICSRVLDELERIEVTAAATILIDGEITSSDINLIVEAVQKLDHIPAQILLNPSGDNLQLVLEANFPSNRISFDPNDFEHAEVRGNQMMAVSKSEGKILGGSPVELQDNDRMYTAGIIDYTVRDWYSETRNSLKSAITQFKPGDLNFVALEVADLRASKSGAQIERVFQAARDFLERDTARVSAVIITASGVIETGPGQWSSTGVGWLFENANAKVPLPKEFSVPNFGHPRVHVRVQSGSTPPAQRA